MTPALTPLKVCFLIPGLSDGGAQKQCVRLLHALSERGDMCVHLVHYRDGIHDRLLRRDVVSATKIPVRSNYDPSNVLRTIGVLKRISPDVIVTWLQACDVYGYFLKQALPGVVWLMTERDSSYPNDFRFWLRRVLGRRADGIICNSVKGREYWDAAKATGKLFVAPNIVEGAGERPSISDSQEILVACVGRMEPQKNPLVVARAFCELAKRRSDIKFQFIGDGALRDKISELIAHEKMQSRIGMLGFRHDAPELIAKARIVVSLSHHEGTPNVLLESVVAGTLVVASDIPEHRELFGPDYQYYCRDRTNPALCADQVERALSCQYPHRELCYAREKVLGMNSGAVAGIYAQIFREMLAHPADISREAA